ncbi:hypothetical protein K3G63_16450 [Hymenobacter sp. HSC-4F20]|uniref:hypothetical protein n=1 Tax=Hymenobacter sp. HSC-4F20 TaxID=2864135 RepID=UPI001C735E6B|nr:hypothetical protein [Hymenobacter sp. HSC-4F20]MBX0292042.1 hypothetical protein [Hymenobacter sp. HSC-4F20]
MNSFTRGVFFLTLAGLGLAVGGCNRDSVPTVEEKLVGRWEWQQTTADNQSRLTPTNTGHQVVVEFDRRGRARFYQDGQLVSAAAFSVRRVMGSFGKPSRHVIIYRGYQNNQFYSVSGNRLQLQDANGKISEHTYIRAAPEVSAQVRAPKEL